MNATIKETVGIVEAVFGKHTSRCLSKKNVSYL